MSTYAYQAEEHIAGEQALFFRATDRLRLEGYVAAMTQNGMSLSMVSEHDAILEHYGKLLIARLREVAPQINLEVYFPDSADALISRFNEILKAYSIADAMSGNLQSAPPKIWMLHDASALPDHEIQLLARLVHNFPGANIRVVMLMTQASQKKQLLSAFGRRILNWDIETPNPEQQTAMLEQARAQGREVLVRELLIQLAPPTPVFLGAPTATPAEKMTQPVPVEKFEKLGLSQRRGKKWSAVIVLLLVACSLSVGLWYRDSIIPLLAADPSQPTVVAADSPTAGAQALPQGISAQTAGGGAKDIEEIIHTQAQAHAGQSWLFEMPAASFVVLHGTASSHQEIKFWLQSQPQLKLAQIVAHTLPNQTGLLFSAISGPFTSVAQAHGFVEGLGMSKDAVVHSAQFIKEQFPSEPKDTAIPALERIR
jgi:hypothetical protein